MTSARPGFFHELLSGFLRLSSNFPSKTSFFGYLVLLPSIFLAKIGSFVFAMPILFGAVVYSLDSIAILALFLVRTRRTVELPSLPSLVGVLVILTMLAAMMGFFGYHTQVSLGEEFERGYLIYLPGFTALGLWTGLSLFCVETGDNEP